MKSTWTILVSILALLHGANALAQLRVLAAEPTWASLAQELGGNLVNVSSASQPLQDPHHIQARPSLIAKTRRADLLIYSGADLEVGWLPLLLRQAGNAKIQKGTNGNLEASRYVHLLEVPSQLTRAAGDIHPQGNPHIQTDPRNIGRVADELAQRLAVLDPDNADIYAKRHADFTERWETAITKWEAQTAGLRNMSIVVHHKNWIYLEHWLDLDEVAELEPKPGVQPSIAHLQRVLEALQKKPAKIIIRAPYFDGKASDWLSKRAHIPAVVLPLTVNGTPQATTLFTMFDDIVAKLAEANR